MDFSEPRAYQLFANDSLLFKVVENDNDRELLQRDTLGRNLADEFQPNKIRRAENLQQKEANLQDRLPAAWPHP